MDKREQEAAELLLSQKDTFIMSWNRADGWYVVNDGCSTLKRDTMYTGGLEGLYEVVMEEDRELLHSYLQKLRSMLQSSTSEQDSGEESKRQSVSLHLKNAADTWDYYRINSYIGDGLPERVVCMIRRMSAEEVYRTQLAKGITNDKNPEYFANEAAGLLERFPDKKFALIQFDVERFKVINEQYGEETGDALLAYFVEKMKMLCTETQFYVRLSADVFMMITSYETEEGLMELIRYLNGELLGYQNIPYRLVFGVCPVTDRTAKIRRYGDGAAFARRSIKGNALKFMEFYREDMRRRAAERKFVEDNMEKALQEGQFVMYLQPKYSISGNHIVGAEALARWKHPDKGLISPACFIPAFEENGFVVKLDRYIWEQACKAIRRWIDQGITPLPVSVNVSRRHLKDGTFVDVLDALVEQYRIPKGYLEIEITETIDENQSAEYIRKLGEHGYRLLMDDFGSGYSSLNMLKDTPFDVIKIDRGFLQDFMGSGRGQEIVRYTIQMTHAIGLDLVAEGVETKDQAEFLSDCGCDIAQGFYYAKPMPLEDFNKKMEMARKP